MAAKKVFFLERGPLVVRYSCWQISVRTTSLSEPSLLSFTSSQMLLLSTMIRWLGLPMSSVTKPLRAWKAISDSAARMSSSGTSSASTTLWSCTAVWRENRPLICCAVLHSSGLNLGSTSSFLRIFISLASSSYTLFKFHQEGLDIISDSGGSFCYLKSPPQWSKGRCSGRASAVYTLQWCWWHIRSTGHLCHHSRPFPPDTVIHGFTVHLKMVLSRVHMVFCLCLGLEYEDASRLLARVDFELVPDVLTQASPLCKLTKWLYHP